MSGITTTMHTHMHALAQKTCVNAFVSSRCRRTPKALHAHMYGPSRDCRSNAQRLSLASSATHLCHRRTGDSSCLRATHGPRWLHSGHLQLCGAAHEGIRAEKVTLGEAASTLRLPRIPRVVHACSSFPMYCTVTKGCLMAATPASSTSSSDSTITVTTRLFVRSFVSFAFIQYTATVLR